MSLSTARLFVLITLGGWVTGNHSMSLGVAEGQDVAARVAWPQFLGPETVPASDALPLKWSDSQDVAWRASIPGYGQSSPVVFQGTVFVTSVSGARKERCHVAAYSLRDGTKQWQRDFAAASQAENTNYVSKAAPTPVVNDLGLVVWFEGGNLIGLSHRGDIRWQRDLVSEYGPIDARHGLGSSLVQHGSDVFVWVERQTNPYVLAVDQATGKTRWKAEGLGATSWSTPCLLRVARETHLVLSGSGKIAGYDPLSGKRLWEFQDVSGNTVPSPRPLGDGRLLIGATVGEGDGPGTQAAKSNGVLQVNRRPDGSYDVAYRWRAARATCSFGSPAADRECVYVVNKSGVLFCLNRANGEEWYAKRLGDSVWATPLAIGNRVYFFGKGGRTVVVKAGQRFEKLAENALPAGDRASDSANDAATRTVYAVIAVGDAFVFRTGRELICIAQR